MPWYWHIQLFVEIDLNEVQDTGNCNDEVQTIESVAVLWRLRNYRDIIIIVIIYHDHRILCTTGHVTVVLLQLAFVFKCCRRSYISL